MQLSAEGCFSSAQAHSYVKCLQRPIVCTSCSNIRFADGEISCDLLGTDEAPRSRPSADRQLGGVSNVNRPQVGSLCFICENGDITKQSNLSAGH